VSRSYSSATLSRHRAPRVRGFSIVEFTVAGFVMLLTLLAALSVSSVSLRAADKNYTEVGQTGGSRQAMDETLYQLRGANEVRSSQVVNGTTTTTGASQVVLAAPGYDPAVARFYLDNVTDYVSLRYDATNKRLLETIVPGTGSVRPVRTNYVLARNVVGCTFTYRVRDYFVSNATGNTRFTLNAKPLSTPRVYVNGVATNGSYNSSNGTYQVNLSSTKSDVQFVYEISPTSGRSAMLLVGEVDVVLQLADKDSRQVTRTMTLQGAARLRNSRK
jgi:hypothetical protein